MRYPEGTISRSGGFCIHETNPKHSQRERICFPGAVSLSIYFDHRCKLDFSSRIFFSLHNRRGADDLGRYWYHPIVGDPSGPTRPGCL